MKIKHFSWMVLALGISLLIFFSGLENASASTRYPQPATDAYTLIAEVNALRAANGLPAYTVNATLMAVAQAHTDYQAATGTVTHYSADGSRPYQRALAAGYPVGGNLTAGGYFSENIVANMGLSPSGAVQIWQGDAPHLNTMLSPYLTEVGAGVATSGGLIYYTLDASTPSSAVIPAYTQDPNATLDPNATPNDVNGALPALDWIMPVITSTPGNDGKVIHEVQVGQSLWGIADIYGTTVQELRALNYLGVDQAIYPGDLLLVRQMPTPLPSTATLSPTLTATIPSSPTIPVLTETSLPASETSSSIQDEQPSQSLHIDSSLWTVLGIILIALLMAALVTWLSSRE